MFVLFLLLSFLLLLLLVWDSVCGFSVSLGIDSIRKSVLVIDFFVVARVENNPTIQKFRSSSS